MNIHPNIIYLKKPNKNQYKYWLYNYLDDNILIEHKNYHYNYNNINYNEFKKYIMYGYINLNNEGPCYPMPNIVSSVFRNYMYEYKNVEYIMSILNIYDFLLNHIYLYQNLEIYNIRHYKYKYNNYILEIGLDLNNLIEIYNDETSISNKQQSCWLNCEEISKNYNISILEFNYHNDNFNLIYPIDCLDCLDCLDCFDNVEGHHKQNNSIFNFEDNNIPNNYKINKILNSKNKYIERLCETMPNIKYIQSKHKYWCNNYSQQFIFNYICNWVCNLFTNDFLIINKQLIPIHEQIVLDYNYNYNIPFDFKKLFNKSNVGIAKQGRSNNQKYYYENIIGFFNHTPNHIIFKDFLGEISNILIDKFNNLSMNTNFNYILQNVLNRIEKMYRYFD